MQKGRVTAVLTAYLVSLRQLGNGKTMNRVNFAKMMLPHELKKGQLLTVTGKKLYEWEGEDCEIIPAKLFEQKVATDAWLNGIVVSMNSFLGTASEQAENESEDSPAEQANEEVGVDEPEIEGHDEELDTSALDKAIKKGKAKKAQKLFDEIEGALGKKERKAYKKQIKGL